MNKHRHCSQICSSAGQVSWSGCPCIHSWMAGGLATGQPRLTSHISGGWLAISWSDRHEGLPSLIIQWGSLGLPHGTWAVSGERTAVVLLAARLISSTTSFWTKQVTRPDSREKWASSLHGGARRPHCQGPGHGGAEERDYSGNMTYSWLLSLAPRWSLSEGGQTSHHMCPSPPPTAIPTFERSCFILGQDGATECSWKPRGQVNMELENDFPNIQGSKDICLRWSGKQDWGEDIQGCGNEVHRGPGPGEEAWYHQQEPLPLIINWHRLI